MVTENTNTDVITKEPMELQEVTRLTDKSIAAISEQMKLAEKLVTTLLVFGQDYGTTPGTQGPGLWDAGAAKIIRAYRCNAAHKILFHEETDDLISWTIETQLVNTAGEITGSGLGACSTREVKYKYRWVSRSDALRADYTEEDLASLKTKPTWDGKDILYRITNPENGELTQTILAMAAKRSECDAAKSLPGVASALRAKFDEKPGKKPAQSNQSETKLSGQDDLTLPVFWSMVKGAGLSEADAHNTLKVTSMNDWTASGKTLRDGIQEILKVSVGAARSRKKTPQSGTAPAPIIKEKVKQKTAAEITAAEVKTADDLIFLVKQFYNIEETTIWASLGYNDKTNFIDASVETPYGAWVKIRNSQKAL